MQPRSFLRMLPQKDRGLRFDSTPHMPKQPNGTPGKKPPAPSVKVRMGRKSLGSLDQPWVANRQLSKGLSQPPEGPSSNLRSSVSGSMCEFCHSHAGQYLQKQSPRLAPQLALIRCGDCDPSVRLDWERAVLSPRPR